MGHPLGIHFTEKGSCHHYGDQIEMSRNRHEQGRVDQAEIVSQVILGQYGLQDLNLWFSLEIRKCGPIPLRISGRRIVKELIISQICLEGLRKDLLRRIEEGSRNCGIQFLDLPPEGMLSVILQSLLLHLTNGIVMLISTIGFWHKAIPQCIVLPSECCCPSVLGSWMRWLLWSCRQSTGILERNMQQSQIHL